MLSSKWIRQVEAMRELWRKLRRAIGFMVSGFIANRPKVLLRGTLATLTMEAVKSFAFPFQPTKRMSTLRPGVVVLTERLLLLMALLVLLIPTPNHLYQRVQTLGTSLVTIRDAFQRLGSAMEMMIA